MNYATKIEMNYATNGERAVRGLRAVIRANLGFLSTAPTSPGYPRGDELCNKRGAGSKRVAGGYPSALRISVHSPY